MSYIIDAFVESRIDRRILIEKIRLIMDNQPIGWIEDDTDSMTNLSTIYVPEKLDKIVFFSITDGKGKVNATYLLDPNDYAPESDINLPKGAQDRQNLLVGLCEKILEIDNVLRIGVALTDSGYIESTKFVSSHEFRNLLSNDFDEADAPPDVLYIIRK